MKYLLFAIFLIIVGCSAVKNFSDPGEKLYAEKCSACHKIYERGEFSAEHWQKVFEEMSKKAKLSEEEKIILRRYIVEGSNL